MRQFMDMDRKIHEELDKMNRDVSLVALGHLIADLKEKYKDNPDVTAFLDSVQSDVLDNLAQFIRRPDEGPQTPFQLPWMKEAPFKKYEVNVVVDNSEAKGAPVG